MLATTPPAPSQEESLLTIPTEVTHTFMMGEPPESVRLRANVATGEIVVLNLATIKSEILRKQLDVIVAKAREALTALSAASATPDIVQTVEEGDDGYAVGLSRPIPRWLAEVGTSIGVFFKMNAALLTLLARMRDYGYIIVPTALGVSGAAAAMMVLRNVLAKYCLGPGGSTRLQNSLTKGRSAIGAGVNILLFVELVAGKIIEHSGRSQEDSAQTVGITAITCAVTAGIAMLINPPSPSANALYFAGMLADLRSTVLAAAAKRSTEQSGKRFRVLAKAITASATTLPCRRSALALITATPTERVAPPGLSTVISFLILAFVAAEQFALAVGIRPIFFQLPLLTLATAGLLSTYLRQIDITLLGRRTLLTIPPLRSRAPRAYRVLKVISELCALTASSGITITSMFFAILTNVRAYGLGAAPGKEFGLVESLSLSFAVGLFAPVLVLILAGRGLGFDPTLARVTPELLKLMVSRGIELSLSDATRARILAVIAAAQRERSAAKPARPSLAARALTTRGPTPVAGEGMNPLLISGQSVAKARAAVRRVSGAGAGSDPTAAGTGLAPSKLNPALVLSRRYVDPTTAAEGLAPPTAPAQIRRPATAARNVRSARASTAASFLPTPIGRSGKGPLASTTSQPKQSVLSVAPPSSHLESDDAAGDEATFSGFNLVARRAPNPAATAVAVAAPAPAPVAIQTILQILADTEAFRTSFSAAESISRAQALQLLAQNRELLTSLAHDLTGEKPSQWRSAYHTFIALRDVLQTQEIAALSKSEALTPELLLLHLNLGAVVLVLQEFERLDPTLKPAISDTITRTNTAFGHGTDILILHRAADTHLKSLHPLPPRLERFTPEAINSILATLLGRSDAPTTDLSSLLFAEANEAKLQAAPPPLQVRAEVLVAAAVAAAGVGVLLGKGEEPLTQNPQGVTVRTGFFTAPVPLVPPVPPVLPSNATATATVTALPSPSIEPSANPTESASSTATPSKTALPSADPTDAATNPASATNTAPVSPTSSPSPAPSGPQTPAATDSPSASKSGATTPTPPVTASKTGSPSGTVSPPATGSPSSEASASGPETPAVTGSPSTSKSGSTTPTPSVTATNTGSQSRTASPPATGSPTRTPTITATFTQTPSGSWTMTLTSTGSVSFSVTRTATGSLSITATPTPSITPSKTGSPSVTASKSRTPSRTPSALPPSATPSPEHSVQPVGQICAYTITANSANCGPSSCQILPLFLSAPADYTGPTVQITILTPVIAYPGYMCTTPTPTPTPTPIPTATATPAAILLDRCAAVDVIDLFAMLNNIRTLRQIEIIGEIKISGVCSMGFRIPINTSRRRALRGGEELESEADLETIPSPPDFIAANQTLLAKYYRVMRNITWVSPPSSSFIPSPSIPIWPPGNISDSTFASPVSTSLPHPDFRLAFSDSAAPAALSAPTFGDTDRGVVGSAYTLAGVLAALFCVRRCRQRTRPSAAADEKPVSASTGSGSNWRLWDALFGKTDSAERGPVGR